MFCIYCGFISDPHPTRLCIICRERIERVNDMANKMYLLKMAYKSVKEIWLMKRIEEVFEKEGKPL